jgi:arabinose-5-phosphate isomerase
MREILENLLLLEKKVITTFIDQLALEPLERVLKMILNCKGIIFFSGVGKSGLIAKKIANTMTSTGTRALFLSPANALHGDIGVVQEIDLCILISKSGETEELNALMPTLRHKKVQTIAIVHNGLSKLARSVDVALVLPEVQELCPFDMAPTASTVTQLIVGDVLSMALMREKKLSQEEYAVMHPAGRIGRRISLKVQDLMLTKEALPTCYPDSLLVDALVELSNKKCGCVLGVDKENQIQGIFTDGDLRRALQNKGTKALEYPVKDLMTKQIRSTAPEIRAFEAMRQMEENREQLIYALPVVDKERRLVGLIKMHDLVQSGI